MEHVLEVCARWYDCKAFSNLSRPDTLEKRVMNWGPQYEEIAIPMMVSLESGRVMRWDTRTEMPFYLF